MKFSLSPQKLNKLNTFLIILLSAFAMLWFAGTARAQDEQPRGPVYIIQEGDNLWDIARRFGIPLEDLRDYNNIAGGDQISPGAEIVIPGLEGVEGVLVTETVPYGESLRSLSRRYQVPQDALARLNRFTSPYELYSGATLIIPQGNASPANSARMGVAPGQSLLELAVIQGANPWSLVDDNHIRGTWDAVPGDVLLFPNESVEDGPASLPGQIQSIEVRPLPLVQGGTVVIRLQATSDLTLSGALMDHELSFFQDDDGAYFSLQGIHALAEPGFYPLTLQGSLSDGTPVDFSQTVYVRPGDYAYETLTVKEDTVDPKNTEPEDEIWNALADPFNPERYWEEIFVNPVPPLYWECFPSFYGSRRSYNGSPYNYFHTGLDFCGGVGAEIYAVAPGRVVFAGDLTVRGKATMIDHGWGVYSGYMHQSEIMVAEGEQVEAGQIIGLIGGTGRVTGPHLHLEIWAGGVQVDPMEWLQKSFP